MNACKTGEFLIRLVDSINISFLVVILYYSYLRHYHWKNWVKSVRGLLVSVFTTARASTTISK